MVLNWLMTEVANKMTPNNLGTKQWAPLFHIGNIYMSDP